ncbi:FAD-dependent oxidoreductase [Mesorhizobium sp. M8A.F.Ca.ET.208.01.1.1]|uniref:GMC family oxidoreductase n=1 Tax=unclassified Mesorhizobium TaxID=325217 RepID=UPI0010936DB3|nr:MULTISPECIES: GMC family oxidoreductase N-terminal domain-containing protein [unclassified Mesorhizobium]TGQ89140.1 FAD-dependent oxidoreductase [Mesorhizobium sp. M8A.F.Ca.ET.208.01.1.1]TGR32244.1 FAD-dependent oxidoreductase [Mesorhizobium sp. M8A.F.Ca.ET.202.01.1.1]TGT50460.1 FAD-dependent oxidoreductase [Mesorhizobium sp. M8A.F.Ca.ET.167.01.1.1]TGU40123.1 FAD-dependent oxidoreductase [bacterium M00.F.Ca.ET.156.01.1.1]
MNEFDYIIVGGGSSGCVVAARLSENPQNKVLLIESGARDTDKFIHIPATFFKVIEKGKDVHFYVSEPDKGLNGKPNVVPQGNVIGGGSSLNAMIYIRGQQQDYDTWAQMGCRNWSYDKVLPVFRDVEANQRLSGEFHGATGYLKVSDRRFGHPLSWAFIRAAQEAGLPYNEDFNGKVQQGVGFYQTTTHNGRRWSAAQAFLRDAEKRANLTILTETRVHKVLFVGRKAVGVLTENGVTYKARREIVLTAGALATPKILQLSGIGEAEHLKSHGIDVIVDLPGVGENYQDHLEATVQAEVKDPISLFTQDKGLKAAGHMLQYLLTKTGLLTSNVVESGGFVDTAGTGQPDIQFHVLPTFIGFADRAVEPGHGIAIGPCFLRPQSRGTVKLRSANPRDSALFNANSFSSPADLDTLVRGVEWAIRIIEAPSLARIVKRRVLPTPGLERDPEALRDYIRSISKTVFHPSGTARMGRPDDRMAVVGEDLAVRGVEGLRVADASIMPTLVSGNTNAPVIMIGERAARFMLGRDLVA